MKREKDMELRKRIQAMRVRRAQTLFALFSLTVVFAAGCSDQAADNQATIKRHLLQSEAYLSQGQFRAAQIEAKNAIQKSPSNIKGHIAMAKISNSLGKHKFAIQRLESLPAEAYQNPEFLVTLAEAYIKRQKYHSAKDFLEQNANAFKQVPTEFTLFQGRVEMGLGNLLAAEALMKQVLETDPENVEALLDLARVEAQQSNFIGASQYIDQAEVLSKSNPDINFLRAQIDMANDRWDLAEKNLTEALSDLPNADIMTPRKSVFLGMLAEILIIQGKSAEALIYTQQIARAFPGMEVAQGEFRDANQLFEQGDFAAAEEKLVALVDEYPGFEEAALLLAVIRYRAGDTESASEYFSGRVDAEISDPNITKLAAISDLRNNQPRRVVNLLEKYVKDSEDAQLLILFGKAAYQSKQSSEAERALQRAIDIDPTVIESYLTLADLYNDQTPPNLEQGLYILRRGSENNADNFQLTASTARQLMFLDRTEDARNMIEDQLAKNDDDPDSLELAGDFYFSQRDFVSAKRYYRQSLDKDQQRFSSAMKFALVQQQLGSFEQTLESYEAAARIAPENPLPLERMFDSASSQAEWEVAESTVRELAASVAPAAGYSVLSAAFANRGDIAQAQQWRAELGKAAPDSPLTRSTDLTIHYALAEQYLRSGDINAARKEILAGLTIEPRATPLLTLLTTIEINQQNYLEAQKLVEQIMRSNVALGNELQGDIYLANNDAIQAAQAFNNAWDARPDDAVANKLFTTLVQLDPPRAEAFLTQWQRRFPNSSAAKSTQATEYLLKQDFASAIPLMEEIRAALPDWVVNLNNLAWAYQQVNNPAALPTAKQAYELSPDSASIADTYGWILFGAGEIEESVAVLGKAAQLAPASAEIQQHLAQAQAALAEQQ